MDKDNYKIWQDTMREVIVLNSLLAEFGKRIDALYIKVDARLDNNSTNNNSTKEQKV